MSYERDIKLLFRSQDREEMSFVFDLWSYVEVKDAAESILERVADGTMPCDAPWNETNIQKFRDWIAEGCPP